MAPYTNVPPVRAFGLVESGGSSLAVGSVADSSVFVRSGASIVGVAADAGAGSFLEWDAVGTVWGNSRRARALGAAIGLGSSGANTTPAAAGAQQYGPVVASEGRGWKTDATAASIACTGGFYVQPVQGAAAPSMKINLAHKIGAAGWVDDLSITCGTSLGGMISTGAVYCSGNSKGGCFAFSGDSGSWGASYVSVTGIVAAPDAGSPAALLGKTPTGIAATSVGWWKSYFAGVVGWVPYWTA